MLTAVCCVLPWQVLSRKFIKVGERSVQVLPKTVGRVQQQQAAQGQQAGASSSQGAAAGAGAKQNQRLLGRNEEGLPQLRGAACCPFYMGTGQCKFRNACKYHHPSHALHPECVAAGEWTTSSGCVACARTGATSSGCCGQPLLLLRCV